MSGQNGSTRAQLPPTDQGSRLAAFVSDLERLRREAGQPSLRKMAGAGHYSHTALSSVLSGTRLPSQELTLAFVRACGGDEGAWLVRWQREHAALSATSPSGPHPVVRRPPVPRRALTAATVSAAAVVLVAGAVIVATGWRRPDRPAATPAGSPTAPAAAPAAPDGTDPQEQHCQFDAMSARTVAVPDRDPAQPPFGSLTLRYSPRCRAAWPLFVSTERVPTGATIRLRAVRPSDGAVSQYDHPFLVRSQIYSVFGNVLQTDRGCVSVDVDVRAADGGSTLAAASTPCLRPGSAG